MSHPDDAARRTPLDPRPQIHPPNPFVDASLAPNTGARNDSIFWRGRTRCHWGREGRGVTVASPFTPPCRRDHHHRDGRNRRTRLGFGLTGLRRFALWFALWSRELGSSDRFGRELFFPSSSFACGCSFAPVAILMLLGYLSGSPPPLESPLSGHASRPLLRPDAGTMSGGEGPGGGEARGPWSVAVV